MLSRNTALSSVSDQVVDEGQKDIWLESMDPRKSNSPKAFLVWIF